MSPASQQRPKVLLHVGTPKTGTTHLQDVLFRNRAVLAAQGVNYPGAHFDSHFRAAIDLMGVKWAELGAESVGAWDEFAEEVRSARGTTIVSHEVLAGATRAQVARALESFGDVEVHLVLSVRDLVRQVPAEWQENIKHHSKTKYADFLDALRDPELSRRSAKWFWKVQGIPDIIDRWGASLPPERIHLVTVPPAGSDPGELWRRFSRAFGLDGLRGLDLTQARANQSLGAPEVALVRRINRRMRGQLTPAQTRPLVRELLVHQTLSQRTDSPRITLPPHLEEWALGLSRTWVEDLRGRGLDVIGDLDDLLGRPSGITPKKWVDPDRPKPARVNAAALDAIEALLLETARLRELEEERNQRRLVVRAREQVLRTLGGTGPGRAALRTYRLRGANWLSAYRPARHVE